MAHKTKWAKVSCLKKKRLKNRVTDQINRKAFRET